MQYNFKLLNVNIINLLECSERYQLNSCLKSVKLKINTFDRKHMLCRTSTKEQMSTLIIWLVTAVYNKLLRIQKFDWIYDQLLANSNILTNKKELNRL